MFWKIFRWGLIPVSAAIAGVGYFSLGKEATTWGIPAWVWLATGNALFFSMVIFIIVGFWRENKRLKKINVATGQTGNTIVITPNNISKEHTELVRKATIAEIENGKIKVKIKRGKIEDLSNVDKSFVIGLGHQMRFTYTHGHDDDMGMLADLACGIPINELITRNCTICGKPRNKPEEE